MKQDLYGPIKKEKETFDTQITKPAILKRLEKILKNIEKKQKEFKTTWGRLYR